MSWAVDFVQCLIYKTSMIRNYSTHLILILLGHALAIFGTWQIAQSDFVQNNLSTTLNPGIIKLQVASRVVMNQPRVETVKPKAKPKKATLPQLPKQETVEEEVHQESVQLGTEKGEGSRGSADVLALYKAELRAKIDQNKFYPPLSRRLGQTGTVVVAFTLEQDGNIIDVKIDSPSQYERLNVSALEAVKKVEKFRPIPSEYGQTRMEIKVPVKFVTI